MKLSALLSIKEVKGDELKRTKDINYF